MAKELIDALKDDHVKLTIGKLVEDIQDASGLHTAGENTAYDDYVYEKICDELYEQLEGVMDDVELMLPTEYVQDLADAEAERQWESREGR